MNTPATTLVAPSRGRIWMSITLAAMLLLSMVSAAIGVQTASAQEGAQKELAAVVPADTVMFMSLDLDQSSEQWTLTQSLLERAGLSQLSEDQTGASTEELGDMAESQGFTGVAGLVFTDADALVNYSGSGIEDTVSSMEVDPETVTEDVPQGFAVVIQPEDPAALSSQFVQMATDEAESAGVELQTVDYNGVTISFWEPAADAPGTATAEIDGTVVLAPRVSDVEPIIDAAQGEVDNLADSDGFNAVNDKLETNSLMFGYINLDVFLTAIENSPEFAEMYDEDMLGDIQAGKGHAGFTLYASEGGFHTDSVVIPNDASTIPAAAEVPAIASKLPADLMIASMSTNFYGTGISDMVGGLMQVALSEGGATGTATATPSATPTIEETWAMFEQQLGFNPDTDLLQKLDGDYAVWAGVYDLESGMPNPAALFVSGTSDAATLEQTSTTITNLVESMNEGDYDVSSRQVEGGELTVITLDAESTGGLPVVIEFGVVNDELLIGINGGVDMYLDASSPKLADDANYQKTMELLPSENVVNVSYVNIEGQVMPLLDWLTAMLGSSTSTLDNHEDCGNYATQVEAQTAYDADPGDLWLLDMDYDGEACEDFFGSAAPQASPESISEQVNVVSAGSVTWTDDSAVYTSSVLVIGD